MTVRRTAAAALALLLLAGCSAAPTAPETPISTAAGVPRLDATPADTTQTEGTARGGNMFGSGT